ncbi:formylglycine-generating enzyme family protein [Sphingobacterium psychroaquaticum]|uniref:formylglycine-generating enzyme family protein n=1 Tax=Sphingobacterium psychroaquaticum TaxID=561061 RepID=UPI00106D1A74|nr:SUMF1/EgtB/PvdO family nonheme iron enzyme [Sphingobacterium psychroaquaticum]QBQ41054.1 formylglycine-generating enzyme family protein [Sphingobacterium psychroaquaticum]
MSINLVKKGSLAFALLATSFLATGQQKHARYVQKLTGTDLEFSMEAIPGGEFAMGSAKSAKQDEKPVHKVKISPFWMSTFEVTWNLYEPFVYKDLEVTKTTDGKVSDKVDAVTRPTKPYLDMTFGMGKEGHPALAMTHYNAIQFCKWLYVRTGVFYRLPTEAEWEYACRAGSTSEYYFGEDATKLNDYAWLSENSNGQTSVVGKKKPNAWGLYDMLGNVAEWTFDQYKEDFYKQFEGKVADNPVSVPTSLYPHSVRGGSFESKPADLRSASRLASDPFWKQLDPQIPKSNWWFPEAPFVGLRLVRPAKAPSHEEIMAYYDKAPIKDF